MNIIRRSYIDKVVIESTEDENLHIPFKLEPFLQATLPILCGDGLLWFRPTRVGGTARMVSFCSSASSGLGSLAHRHDPDT